MLLVADPCFKNLGSRKRKEDEYSFVDISAGSTFSLRKLLYVSTE
jgi:hypothetical protein